MAVVAINNLVLNEETQLKLNKLEAFDLSSITNRFTDEDHQQGRKFSNEQIYPIVAHFGKADIELATKIEKEFKRFVALTLIGPGVTHAPSGPVDMYWHFLILHTAFYRQFCDEIWGGFEPCHNGYELKNQTGHFSESIDRSESAISI